MEKKLGFGMMRLPSVDPNDPSKIDIEQVSKMVDLFLERGFTYFDTAYTYHGYQCEKAVRKALVERHPRSAFELVTKMPLRDFKDTADLETIFNEQRTNCGVDYFDYCLLHNMGTNVYEKCRKYGAFDFIASKFENSSAYPQRK